VELRQVKIGSVQSTSNRAVGRPQPGVATGMAVVIAVLWGFAFVMFAAAGISPVALLLGGGVTAVAAIAGLISWAADQLRYAD